MDRDAVGDAINEILEGRDHSAVDVLVDTFTSSVRDRLRQQYGMVAWEDLDPMAILCENVHRVKGLEYTTSSSSSTTTTSATNSST